MCLNEGIYVRVEMPQTRDVTFATSLAARVARRRARAATQATSITEHRSERPVRARYRRRKVTLHLLPGETKLPYAQELIDQLWANVFLAKPYRGERRAEFLADLGEEGPAWGEAARWIRQAYPQLAALDYSLIEQLGWPERWAAARQRTAQWRERYKQTATSGGIVLGDGQPGWFAWFLLCLLLSSAWRVLFAAKPSDARPFPQFRPIAAKDGIERPFFGK